MKYGEVATVKKSVSLTLTTTTVTTVPQNPDTERVKPDYSTSESLTTVTTVNEATVVNRSHTVVKGRLQSESLPDKGLEPTVVTVVTNSPLSEKSENLLLSCPAEPAEIADEALTKMLVDEMRNILNNPSHEEAWEIWNQIKNDPQKQSFFYEALTEEEGRKSRVLFFIKNFSEGTRLKYVGKGYGKQFEGIELKLYDAQGNSEITCLKPDGSFVNLPIRDIRPL